MSPTRRGSGDARGSRACWSRPGRPTRRAPRSSRLGASGASTQSSSRRFASVSRCSPATSCSRDSTCCRRSTESSRAYSSCCSSNAPALQSSIQSRYSSAHTTSFGPPISLLELASRIRGRCISRPGDDLPRLVAPVVVKPRFGSWGLDIFRCDSEDELARQLEQLGTRPWFRRHGALLQELVTPRGYDLRVLVAGGTTVGAVERVAAPGEWRTNISLGGRRRRCAPSATASALAEAAAAAIGADFVGVDLLPTDHGHVIVELNAAADFNALYSRPGSDIYTDLAVALGLSAGAEPPTTSAGLARSRAPAALVAAASATVAR